MAKGHHKCLASGDIARLLDEYGPALRLYASGWSNEPDDCVQEALIEIAAQVPPPERPLAWLYRVIRRRAHSHYRSESRRTKHETIAAERRRAVETTTESAELRDLLAQLDDTSRELVVLKIWGNQTFAEIAEITGCSTSTLHRDYAAAIERLRTLWTAPTDPIATESSHVI